MTYPKVGIVVLNWNGLADTTKCLESLKDLNYPNCEILVVDNGSTDGSGDEIRRKFPYINMIENKQNLGFAEGNNVGIQYFFDKDFNYFLLLNNDTVVDKELLKYMVEFAESDKKIGMVGPKIYYMDIPNKIWFAGGGINYLIGRVYHFGKNRIDHGQFDRENDVDFLTGCALLVKKEVIERVGFLDPQYFNFNEDADWCIRAKAAGYRLVYVPKSKIWHRLAVSMGGRFSPFHIYYRIRNNLLLVTKNKFPITAYIYPLIYYPLQILIWTLLTFNIKGFQAAVAGIIDFFNGNLGRGTLFSK